MGKEKPDRVWSQDVREEMYDLLLGA